MTCPVKTLSALLIITPLVAGILGIKGKIHPHLLAKIALATHGPLFVYTLGEMGNNCMNPKSQASKASSSAAEPVSKVSSGSDASRKEITHHLYRAFFAAWFASGIALSILALQGKVTAHQLSWGALCGPFLLFMSFPVLACIGKDISKTYIKFCRIETS